MTRPQRLENHYEAQNLECARILLADRERFGGEESLPVRWARLVVRRACHSDPHAALPAG